MILSASQSLSDFFLKGDPSSCSEGAPALLHHVPQFGGLRPGRPVVPKPPGGAGDGGGAGDPADFREGGAAPAGERDGSARPDHPQVTTTLGLRRWTWSACTAAAFSSLVACLV